MQTRVLWTHHGELLCGMAFQKLLRRCHSKSRNAQEFVGFIKEHNSPNSRSLCLQIKLPVHYAWTSFVLSGRSVLFFTGSDGSLSDAEMGDESDGVSQHQRRMRTKFTSEQIRKLESTFSKHRYLSALQRRKIAERLSLSEIQVGV